MGGQGWTVRVRPGSGEVLFATVLEGASLPADANVNARRVSLFVTDDIIHHPIPLC